MIFFQTGYARVTKVLNISGPFKDWDNSSQSFKSKAIDSTATNKLLFDLKIKYQRVAEQWEAEGRKWSPVELSHCFDEKEAQKSESKVLSVSQMIDYLIDKFRKKERIKNGKIIDSSNNVKTYECLKRSLTEFTKQQYGRSFSSYFFKDISRRVRDF